MSATQLDASRRIVDGKGRLACQMQLRSELQRQETASRRGMTGSGAARSSQINWEDAKRDWDRGASRVRHAGETSESRDFHPSPGPTRGNGIAQGSTVKSATVCANGLPLGIAAEPGRRDDRDTVRMTPPSSAPMRARGGCYSGRTRSPGFKVRDS
jgi:hypothetical protein